MHPLLFAIYIWERLVLWAEWLKGPSGDVIGATMTALIIAIAVAGYVRRDNVKPLFEWIVARPLASSVLMTPLAALVLLCLTKFATFIGAALTTAGLLIALDNNRTSHSREARRFARQGKAARAALSLDLSAINSYVEECITSLTRMPNEQGRASSNDALPPPLPIPVPPATASATLKEMINSTENEHVADRCALVLSHLQIVHANMSGLARGSHSIACIDLKIRLMVLNSITASLFGFSRKGELNLPDIDWQSVKLNAMLYHLDTDSEFEITLHRNMKHYKDGPLSMYENALQKIG